MEYLKFYGLDAEPFQNNSDVRFYYESRAQHHARMRVLRGIQQRRGLCVVVGEAGLGKTTLAAHLAASLDPQRFAVRLRVIPHVACANGWLLPEFARSFDAGDSGSNPARVIERIEYSLLKARAARRHPVLIFDEAQLLSSPEAMQEFRALLNLQEDGQPLLSIALFGLKQLSDVLRLDPSLAQRVDVRAEMGPLEHEEVPLYIAHRLITAGGTPDLFSSEALELLARLGGGIPRLVNTLADNALFEGSLVEARPIGPDAVWAAAEQLGLTGEEGMRPQIPEVPLVDDSEPVAVVPSAPAPVVARDTPERATPRRAAKVAAPPPARVVSAPAPAPAARPVAARAEIPVPAPRPIPAPAPTPQIAPDPIDDEDEMLGGGDTDEELFAGLIADPDPSFGDEELEIDADADIEVLLEPEAAILLDELAVEAPAASATPLVADDLLDMAEFLEVEVEVEKPPAPAPKVASARAKPAAAPAPTPKVAEPEPDGDLDDLFEQIQLAD